MRKQVYISADYSESDGDKDVVDELNKWGNDDYHRVDFVDMSQVASGSVSKEPDCRICDLKAEFNSQINASSAVIFVVGYMTRYRTAGQSCGRVGKTTQWEAYCTPYKQNTNGTRLCKYVSTVPTTGNNVSSINNYSYLRHEFEQAARQKKNIIILYNSTRYENEWLPSYMSDYKNVARPFWITNYWGQRVGDYSYIKEALGFLIKIFCKSATWAFGIISVIFAFVPESFFHTIRWIPAQAVQKSLTDKGITDVELDTIISRIVCYAVVWVIVTLIYAVRHSVTIKGDNYTIQVKYGNLLKETNCKKVINFDECYTTHIGPNPSDIKASSICGQYIQSVGGSLNIQNLIDNAEVKPEECVSRFNHSRSYKPGSIIVNGDALLLAFATLNKAGRAKFFTQDEYIECLSEMWKQIEVHCSQTDVCVPILGSGLTLFEGASLSQQELLNIMIWSYKLSPHKIKAPYKLRIICKKSDGFSLNEIDA